MFDSLLPQFPTGHSIKTYNTFPKQMLKKHADFPTRLTNDQNSCTHIAEIKWEGIDMWLIPGDNKWSIPYNAPYCLSSTIV